MEYNDGFHTLTLGVGGGGGGGVFFNLLGDFVKFLCNGKIFCPETWGVFHNMHMYRQNFKIKFSSIDHLLLPLFSKSVKTNKNSYIYVNPFQI